MERERIGVAHGDEDWWICGRNVRRHRHLRHERIVRIGDADVKPDNRAHEICERPLEIHGCRVIGVTEEHHPTQRRPRHAGIDPHPPGVVRIGDDQRRLRGDLRASRIAGQKDAFGIDVETLCVGNDMRQLPTVTKPRAASICR